MLREQRGERVADCIISFASDVMEVAEDCWDEGERGGDFENCRPAATQARLVNSGQKSKKNLQFIYSSSVDTSLP